MRVNVGQAKTDLSKLLVLVEAGEAVEIARNGVTVARLVPAAQQSPGEAFLAAGGSLAGRVVFHGDGELSEAELDEILDEPA